METYKFMQGEEVMELLSWTNLPWMITVARVGKDRKDFSKWTLLVEAVHTHNESEEEDDE